jgi:NAD(P)-dependent dehydrogenase (short-subunit alcohol dehydrogenase family)
VDSVRVAPEEVALPLAGFAGRRVIVAGRASGIGRATALRFAQLGADVVVLDILIPMKRMAQPEEPADAIVFLASDSASYITGQILSVNGGLNML